MVYFTKDSLLMESDRMGLEMNIDGIQVKLEIRGYVLSDRKDWDREWCQLDYSFSSGEWLNYSKKNDPMLLSCEIDTLVQALTDLLDNKITEKQEVSFLDPDFEFELSPSFDLRNNPKFIYVEPGCEIIDISLDWRVFFYHEAATANFLSVTLDRNDIRQFLDYLISIQNKE